MEPICGVACINYLVTANTKTIENSLTMSSRAHTKQQQQYCKKDATMKVNREKKEDSQKLVSDTKGRSKIISYKRQQKTKKYVGLVSNPKKHILLFKEHSK
jgi:hypothetical protein